MWWSAWSRHQTLTPKGGVSPGRHIHPGNLTTRLGKLFSNRAARLGTLHELTKLAPVAIIAETLGYSPTTIERQATDSAAAYAQYIAAAKNARSVTRIDRLPETASK